MNNFKSIYKKINNDELTDYINRTETKLSRDSTILKLDEIKRYLSIRGHTNSVNIINYLYNNYLLEKIVFITDTSYRNAYIRIDEKNGIIIRFDNKIVTSSMNSIKAKDIINDIFFEYDKIFICFVRKTKFC